MMDLYLHICSKPSVASVYCSRFCGICGPTTTTSTQPTTSTITATTTTSMTTTPSTTPSSSTSTPYTTTTTTYGTTKNSTTCVDKPGVDCQLLESTLQLCSNAAMAQSYCPKYCGVCGSTSISQSTSTASFQPSSTSSTAASTTSTASTSMASSTGSTTPVQSSSSIGTTTTSSTTANGCVNKLGIDCALLNSHLKICQDKQLAQSYCPKYCGQCSSKTAQMSSPVTTTPSLSTLISSSSTLSTIASSLPSSTFSSSSTSNAPTSTFPSTSTGKD